MESENQKYLGKTVRITDNLEDHVGYNGEDLKIVSVEEEDYFTVENDKGIQWFTGIEELDIFKY